jgi:hypothetical protein
MGARMVLLCRTATRSLCDLFDGNDHLVSMPLSYQSDNDLAHAILQCT